MLKAVRNLSPEEALKVKAALEKFIEDGIGVYFGRDEKKGQSFIQIECPSESFNALELPEDFSEFEYPVFFGKGRGTTMENVASISKAKVTKLVFELDMLAGRGAIHVV